MTIYFAKDGNYGDAYALFMCSTDKWSEEDWEQVELSPDSERVYVAMEIASKYA